MSVCLSVLSSVCPMSDCLSLPVSDSLSVPLSQSISHRLSLHLFMNYEDYAVCAFICVFGTCLGTPMTQPIKGLIGIGLMSNSFRTIFVMSQV